MLLSTATKAEIRVTVVHDSFVRTRHLTSSVDCMVTGVIVIRAHDHSRSFRSLWPCLSLHIWKPLRHSCGKHSEHKFEHKSSCQRCFLPSPGCHSNQFLLKQCYLCRQQQPPCGETATPSRTQSTYHNLLREGCGTGGHCCQAWRSQKVCLLLPALLLSWRPANQ